MLLQEHLLIILAEECSEVAQRASKALRFGLREILAFKKAGFMSDDMNLLAQILLDPTNKFLQPVLKELLFDSLYTESLATPLYENWIGYKKQVEDVLRTPVGPKLDYL